MILAADYSQLELRVLAHLSKDQRLLQVSSIGHKLLQKKLRMHRFHFVLCFFETVNPNPPTGVLFFNNTPQHAFLGHGQLSQVLLQHKHKFNTKSPLACIYTTGISVAALALILQARGGYRYLTPVSSQLLIMVLVSVHASKKLKVNNKYQPTISTNAEPSRAPQVLNGGTDVFKCIAAEWKGVELDSVNDTLRQQAKQVELGRTEQTGSRCRTHTHSSLRAHAWLFADLLRHHLRHGGQVSGGANGGGRERRRLLHRELQGQIQRFSLRLLVGFAGFALSHIIGASWQHF